MFIKKPVPAKIPKEGSIITKAARVIRYLDAQMPVEGDVSAVRSPRSVPWDTLLKNLGEDGWARLDGWGRIENDIQVFQKVRAYHLYIITFN